MWMMEDARVPNWVPNKLLLLQVGAGGWGCTDMACISMPVLIAADMDTDGGSGCE